MITIESHILPSTSVWALAMAHGGMIIEAHENYQKRSYRNRYEIIGADGPGTLSVPLSKGKNNQQNIRNVTIDYGTDWIRQHLKVIRQAYINAPFFGYYYPMIKNQLEKRHKFLFELNMALLLVIRDILLPELKLASTSEYQKKRHNLDFRNLGIHGMESFYTVPYAQSNAYKYGYISQLSILDLIMNMGPESADYLRLKDA